MVAVIHQRKSFGNALHYNEHKLKVVIDAQKQIYAAEFIHASGL